ncbi:polysaccharide deacetylase family protein [Vagococcus silagei]|uniref:Polysaccharide deacetylase family protein n=1 Tax=Vagococcus silagei TaxID=2508885 RepID=A0A4S3B482_9ENTE|nr:polysaccharide deacetylase family protein [Vagococcus silagei]THB61954.1 polysaccharide deacetylase family protein [Vagococcus silagei]
MKKWITALSLILIVEIVVVGALIYRHETNLPKEVEIETSQKIISHVKKNTPKTKQVNNLKLPIDQWTDNENKAPFPILMYHSFEKSDDGNTLKIDPAEFEEQMRWLKDNDYYTLNTDEAITVLKINKVPSNKIIWLTFDDGYLNNFTQAFPILQKYQLSATINFITSKLGSSSYFNLEQMNEMKTSQLVDIQSHTVSHLDLNTLSDDQIKTELADSKKWLDEKLAQDTKLLCYPAGRYDERVKRIANEVGYELAITTEPGLASSQADPFALKRVRMEPGLNYEGFGNLIKQLTQN